MDGEKQIERMAQLIADNCTIHKVYANKHYPDRQKDVYYSLAEELLKYYHPIDTDRRKLLHKMYEQGRFDAIADLNKEGKVVFSKEEIEEQISSEVLKRTYQEFDSLYKTASKETTEKFIVWLKENIISWGVCGNGKIKGNLRMSFAMFSFPWHFTNVY